MKHKGKRGIAFRVPFTSEQLKALEDSIKTIREGKKDFLEIRGISEKGDPMSLIVRKGQDKIFLLDFIISIEQFAQKVARKIEEQEDV